MKLENKVSLERKTRKESEILKRKLSEFTHEASIFQSFDHEKKRVLTANKHRYQPVKQLLEELINLDVNQSNTLFLRGLYHFREAEKWYFENLHNRLIRKYIID